MYTGVHLDVAWESSAYQTSTTFCKSLDLVITATLCCLYIVEPKLEVVGFSFSLP